MENDSLNLKDQSNNSFKEFVNDATQLYADAIKVLRDMEQDDSLPFDKSDMEIEQYIRNKGLSGGSYSVCKIIADSFKQYKANEIIL